METLHSRAPGPALAPYVELLWYYRVDGPSPRPEAVLPHGEFELVISLSGSAEDTLISGPHTRPMVVDPGGFSPIIGAHFRPGGAAAMFGHSARAFRDLDVPLADISTNRARDLHARLSGIDDPELALRSIEEELTRYALTAPSQHPAVSMAIDEIHSTTNPPPRIRDLVNASGLSQRRFIELFTDRVGLTPKLYARIRRFQKALGRAADVKPIDWAAIAFELGYSDQAHLIREFRAFSSLSPGQYQPRLPEHPNHVPLP